PKAISGEYAKQEWPQFRGLHNGNAPELPGDPAKLSLSNIWTVPTANGFSSFAIADSKAYTLVTRDDNETLVALDVKDGSECWSKPLALAKYDGGGDNGTRDNKGGDGARSTPRVNDGKVYVIDGKIVVWCFDAKTGKDLWKYDVMEQSKGENIRWQN